MPVLPLPLTPHLLSQALTDRVEQLATNIETTQGVLELTLDNERNRIARLELLLSMAGLAVGASACVSSFFGMNLVSGLEVSCSITGPTRGAKCRVDAKR